MTDRQRVEQLVRELHAARLASDLERLCALFVDDAQLRIIGTSAGKPIAIGASGAGQIRIWLAMMVKTFWLSEYQLLSVLVDDERAVAHWRVQIRSKVTGTLVPTELVDVVDTREAHIAAHTELFVPLGPGSLAA